MNPPKSQLSGKVALVTGASKGIGAAIAQELADAGASVVVNYASASADAAGVVSAIAARGGQAHAIQANVSQSADVDRLFAEIKSRYGRLDVLVNNAGLYQGQPVGGITEDNFHRHFDLNVLGVILTTQAALPLFGPEGGSIINVSSIVSTLAPVGTAVYNASKAAVDCLTRTFARELGARKIRVNTVNPGPIETEGTHAAGFTSHFDSFATLTPLGRVGQPRDIAPVVAFLASPNSGWITGESLFVTGGLR
jgi:3-oxoacyl-[acyl-carrier protein] reductase